jgi:hypothetical protein
MENKTTTIHDLRERPVLTLFYLYFKFFLVDYLG